MIILVKTLTGLVIEVDCEPMDTISRMKYLIEEAEGIPIRLQRLLFTGK